jgi:hypothetical protein
MAGRDSATKLSQALAAGVDASVEVFIGVALFKLATLGGRAILGALARRAAQKAAATAEARVLTRLAETAGNLQNQVVKRSSEVLKAPKVFRQTITADVPPAAYANIENERALRLSTGAKAHYGERAYAWLRGQTGVGIYIEVEVAAGTGVETLNVNGQTFVRMLPAEGNLVRVRIVGTNLTPDQIALGRRLVAGN